MAIPPSSQQSLNVRLGSDTTFPINGSFQAVAGVNLLLQDIQLLILTSLGERVFHPSFGSNLNSQIWENIDAAAAGVVATVTTAINKYESRIKLLGVTTNINRNTGLIIVQINFIINNTDQALNLVFPFRSGTTLSFA